MLNTNLLHLTLSMGVGGIENLILSMARLLDKQRFTVSVGCLDSGGILLKEVNSLGCETFVLSRSDGFDLRLVVQLAKVLRARKIHILHTHNQAAHFYGCLAGLLARTPVVINTEHSRHYIDGHWRRRLEKKVLSYFTDKIVNVSKDLLENSISRDKIAPQKTNLVLNGIDLSFYAASPPNLSLSERAALRAEFDIPEENSIIGIIGRLHPVKNHKLIFEVIQHIVVKRQITAVSLLVVGDGEQKIYLEELAKSLSITNNVHFAGVRQDIPAILSIVNVLVLCSHTEGLPLTLLEAMAAEVPVIVTEGANKSELIQHGKNGFVADSTIASLAPIVTELLGSANNEKIVNAAKALVYRQYSIDTALTKYQDLYDNLLSNKLKHL